MSLYPSLEDMNLDQLIKAQQRLPSAMQESTSEKKFQYTKFVDGYPYPSISHDSSNSHLQKPYSHSSDDYPCPKDSAIFNNSLACIYPTLNEFMGLELSTEVIAQNMQEYGQLTVPRTSVIPSSSTSSNNLVAPLSNQTLGLQKAQITHGIRELILCKDADGKVGMRVKAIDKGIFVALVIDKSPAALAGLRFGDQILQINGVSVAGFTMEEVHKLLKKSPVNGISIIVRDRPFERTITLHKDNSGLLGFQFKNGKITAIVKDSSAAKNGVLLEHQILEIDGQNVVGLKDKDITKIIDKCLRVVTITVIPSFIYDHMVKRMAGSLLKELMDHSTPNI